MSYDIMIIHCTKCLVLLDATANEEDKSIYSEVKAKPYCRRCSLKKAQKFNQEYLNIAMRRLA